MVVTGRCEPETQLSGPAPDLSDVSQLETWLVWGQDTQGTGGPCADSPQHGRQYQGKAGAKIMMSLPCAGLITLPLLQGATKKALTHALQCFSGCFLG